MPSLVLRLGLVGLGLAAPALAIASEGAGGCGAPADAARAAVAAYIDTFNSKDIDRFEATMHYPNVRHADGQIVVAEAPTGDPRLFDAMAAMGWDHTTLDQVDVLQCSAEKVHVAVRVTRHGTDGPLHSFNSLYVVTPKDGQWKIVMRSSYAPERLAPPPPR